jgi:GTPase SAR1 family protein
MDLRKKSSTATTTNSPVNVKLLLIGNTSVGKSSLLLRFLDEQWLTEDKASAMIGIDFHVHSSFRAFSHWRWSHVLTLVGIGAQDGGQWTESETQYMGVLVLSFPCICVIMMSVLQDTVGQEWFCTITSSYYHGAQGIVLGVFLLTFMRWRFRGLIMLWYSVWCSNPRDIQSTSEMLFGNWHLCLNHSAEDYC